MQLNGEVTKLDSKTVEHAHWVWKIFNNDHAHWRATSGNSPPSSFGFLRRADSNERNDQRKLDEQHPPTNEPHKVGEGSIFVRKTQHITRKGGARNERAQTKTQRHACSDEAGGLTS